MKDNSSIKSIDIEIEKMLSYRDQLDNGEFTPPLWTYSNYPIFRKYRAQLKINGPTPQWAENADEIDLKIVDAAPPIPSDLEVQRHAAKLHLKRNRPTPIHKRPVIQTMVAMLVLSIIIVSNDAETFIPSFVTERTNAPRVQAFREETTGAVVVTSHNDSLAASKLYNTRVSPSRQLSSAVRWSLGESCMFFMTYPSEFGAHSLTEAVECPNGPPTESLMKLLIDNSDELVKELEKEESLPYESEVVVVEGVSISFRKWRIQTPLKEEVEYWYGLPVTLHQSPSDKQP